MKNVTRLYKYIHPKHYDLSISISEDKKSFTGEVTLVFDKVGQPTNRITLHSKDLKIDQVSLQKIDKKTGEVTEVAIERINLQKTYDELRIHTAKEIYPSEYRATISFSGKITDQMDGIYPCNFTHYGKELQLIGTQFESHHARQAFPCIDEPEAKATFSFTLEHDASETPLSNTEVESKSVDKKRQTTSFKKTPIMSTYLLAFVVGNMSSKEAVSKNGVKIRTWATPDQIENTEFALENAVKYMDFYEEYYDIPFPLEKCDFIALPDFASGAMENWGLITFREQALLVDEHTSLSSKQYVAIVVAHELTHQWFGNLVTMQWWTDLWLNEGFASWMEYLAVNDSYPEWHLWTQFSVDEQQTALKLDALEHTHPVEVPIKHPDEIRTIFDAISYQKGASVIHMLHDYLGPDAFRDGLRSYLKKHAYKNTVTEDLWASLQEVSGKPVKEFMHSWTSQPGFPVVHIEHKHNHLELSQKRFIANPKSTLRDASDELWPVPLSTDGTTNDELKKLFSDKAKNVQIKNTSEIPTKINIGQQGFYRSTYGESIREAQLKALKNGEFDSLDRMGLLADAYEVTKAGYSSVDSLLDIVELFKDEHELAAWEIIAGALSSIRWTLSESDEDETLRELINPFISTLVDAQYKRLGWEGDEHENHLDALLRPLIVGMACGAKHSEATHEAKRLFKARVEDNVKLHADTRGSVLSTAARYGGQSEFDHMIEMYKTSTSSDEKLSLTGALTSFEQPEIHEQVLALLKDQKVIRLQDLAYWIAYSLSNRHMKQTMWNWVQENWLWLEEMIGQDLSFSRMPVYVARNFATDDELESYKLFFTQHLKPSLQRSFDQGVEIIETSTEWRKRDAAKAKAWFKKH